MSSTAITVVFDFSIQFTQFHLLSKTSFLLKNRSLPLRQIRVRLKERRTKTLALIAIEKDISMSTSGDDHALADVTSQMVNAQINTNEESAKRARDGGWAPPTEFNYSAYNASTKEERAAVGEPAWASNATKYEWNDEYGDIGPPHPELEKMLFSNENQMKKGPNFDK